MCKRGLIATSPIIGPPIGDTIHTGVSWPPTATKKNTNNQKIRGDKELHATNVIGLQDYS